MKTKKSRDEKIWTFTKRLIFLITICAIIWITWSYALATYAAIHGSYTVVESLSKTVCTVVIAGVLGYLCKSFFETFCEKHNDMVKNGLDKFHIPFFKAQDDDGETSPINTVDIAPEEYTETESEYSDEEYDGEETADEAED